MAACNYNADATVDDGSCDYGTMCWDGSYECDASDCSDDPGGWDGDACSMPDFSLHVTSGGSILYNSSSSIAGFQFNVDGASVLSASGGEAEAADFMISSSAMTVLGFSLTGTTIDGCGTMIELELDGEATGLSDFIVSDTDGEALPFEYFDGSGGGGDPYCGDGECNGDEDNASCPEDCEAGGGDWDGDACSMPTNTVHLTSGGAVYFNTDTPLAGFQMDIDGDATILSASGGEAEAAEFMISSGGNTVLGFSLTGATIDGCGTLVELELDGEATG
ncbi:uncharacterized protein METZ01_LOCUS400944, partial [marine metagenome]